MFSLQATLPAMRVTKRSPNPWSKTISMGTRESAQSRKRAKGFLSGGQCTDAVHIAVFGQWLSGGETLIALVEFLQGIGRCDVGGCVVSVGECGIDGCGE
ncbi:MAG: hypothetical protein RIT02_1365 [Planctomycetota bacterium]